MRGRFSVLAGLMLAVGVAVPASASSLERFPFDDVFVDAYSCGVEITTEVHGDVTVHPEADGSVRFVQVRLMYTGTALDPDTGRTIELLPDRQIILDAGDTIATSGQGMFIRLPGEGVILRDVGRLVFDPSDSSTIKASAHVIPFDDPATESEIDAAVCALFE